MSHSSASQAAQQRQQLRRQLRQQRRSLDAHTQEQHALSLAQQLAAHSLFKRSKRIAAYLAADGEIDPCYIIERAWQANKQVFLPVLAPTADRLYFAPYTPSTRMKPNRFNINEPDIHPAHWLRAQHLDLILMPMVGFDANGNRLGMGGGFYDRSLNFSRYRKTPYAPYLVGLAHQLQQVKSLPHQPHDVPMSMMATETAVYRP